MEGKVIGIWTIVNTEKNPPTILWGFYLTDSEAACSAPKRKKKSIFFGPS